MPMPVFFRHIIRCWKEWRTRLRGSSRNKSESILAKKFRACSRLINNEANVNISRKNILTELTRLIFLITRLLKFTFYSRSAVCQVQMKNYLAAYFLPPLSTSLIPYFFKYPNYKASIWLYSYLQTSANIVRLFFARSVVLTVYSSSHFLQYHLILCFCNYTSVRRLHNSLPLRVQFTYFRYSYRIHSPATQDKHY